MEMEAMVGVEADLFIAVEAAASRPEPEDRFLWPPAWSGVGVGATEVRLVAKPTLGEDTAVELTDCETGMGRMVCLGCLRILRVLVLLWSVWSRWPGGAGTSIKKAQSSTERQRRTSDTGDRTEEEGQQERE